jgi:hypothetical protein
VTSKEPYSDDDEFTDIELAEVDESESTGASFGATSPVAPAASPASASASAAEVPAEQSSLEAQLGAARARAGELQQYRANLAQLDGAELPDHVAYYQHAHSELQRALGEIDNA